MEFSVNRFSPQNFLCQDKISYPLKSAFDNFAVNFLVKILYSGPPKAHTNEFDLKKKC